MSLKLPEELELEVYRCFRCGFCRAQCVVFDAKQNESWNTRGRMILVRELMEGKLKATSPVLERLYSCSLCKACETNCPAAVRTNDIFKNVRTEIFNSPLCPSILKAVSASIQNQKNIYELPNDERNIWAMDVGSKVSLKVGKKAKVAYFVGCVSSFMGRLEGIPKSMMRILDQAEVDFAVLGPDEWCCGDPLFLAGAFQSADEIALHNVEALRRMGVETLVATCAGCYRAFRQDYPEVLGEDLGFEVLHASEFLARLIDEDKLKFGNRFRDVVTYHDPCELGRHCNIYEAPRKVLENIPNVKLIELPRTKGECKCCGGGGLLKATNPKLALDIASQKLLEAVEVGAKTITSACPACKLNISDAIMERGSELEMLDITEIVAKALNTHR